MSDREKRSEMSEAARKRRRRRLLMRVKQRREEHAREAKERSAAPEASRARHTPDQVERRPARPYQRGRELIGFLKSALVVLAVIVLLLLLVITAISASVIPGEGVLLVVIAGLQQAAIIIFAAIFLYVILLALEAVFDIGDQTRESLELQREAFAEVQFSGVMLSEIAEALTDTQEAEVEEEDAETEETEETEETAKESDRDEPAGSAPRPDENPDPADPDA